MKFSILVLLAVSALCGCATSTIPKRAQERAPVYSGLPPDMKSLVDQGRIKNGMPMDAVYIAWGRPAQILSGEGPSGVSTVTWLYQGTSLEETRYWAYRPRFHGYRYYPEATLEHDYYPRGYVSAEVTFENGVVRAWRSLPRPAY